MPLLLGDQDVDQLMTMQECVQVMDDAFQQAGRGDTWNRPRSRIRMPGGFHHLMAAAVLDSKVFGLKTYTSFRAGTRFLTILYDSETGDILAMVQGGRCSQLRTGAVSAVATKYMARENASTVGVLGSGAYAPDQLAAVCAVRDIKTAKVFSRRPEPRKKFADDMSGKLGIEVTPAESAKECITDVDVIITITRSPTAVLFGEWLELIRNRDADHL